MFFAPSQKKLFFIYGQKEKDVLISLYIMPFWKGKICMKSISTIIGKAGYGNDRHFDIRFINAKVHKWQPTTVDVFEKAPRGDDALFLYTGGQGAVYTFPDGSTMTAGIGDLVYLPVGTQYVVRLNGDPAVPGSTLDYMEMVFRLRTFSGETCRLYDDVTIISRNDPSPWYPYYERLIKLYTECGSYLEMASVAYEFIDKIISTPAANESRGRYDGIVKGIGYIADNWNTECKISDIAFKCGMSPQNFRILFKEYTGLSPSEYRQSIIMQKTKHMLISTDISMNAVANLAGFSDQFYFSRFFSERAGISPLKYRKMFKGESTGEV